jgi:hypothetical protein
VLPSIYLLVERQAEKAHLSIPPDWENS